MSPFWCELTPQSGFMSVDWSPGASAYTTPDLVTFIQAGDSVLCVPLGHMGVFKISLYLTASLCSVSQALLGALRSCLHSIKVDQSTQFSEVSDQSSPVFDSCAIQKYQS